MAGKGSDCQKVAALYETPHGFSAQLQRFLETGNIVVISFDQPRHALVVLWTRRSQFLGLRPKWSKDGQTCTSRSEQYQSRWKVVELNGWRSFADRTCLRMNVPSAFVGYASSDALLCMALRIDAKSL
eukprot:gnl/MRDRNA2_/MRDRNA2_107662_c0_seq1.p1 gnl/MRDRNA2_/MRDRNA2_107662_c0~~gnl/MRDRNA2_/MRDRNA2_107662_c0_seq1.p1  ORF type:complete len:128 (+),score=13.80 gnl/MRDRNA2_/MRDRNA2_107662_c0_seq1:343-726(+)